jgi:hypothetical protein
LGTSHTARGFPANFLVVKTSRVVNCRLAIFDMRAKGIVSSDVWCMPGIGGYVKRNTQEDGRS